MQNSITGEAPRHRRSVVHRNPTAWHCVCHQQRGQAVGHFDVSTFLLCCTSTVLHGPAIIIGIAQPQEPATPTSFPLKEPLDRASPSTTTDSRTLSSIPKTVGGEGTTKKPHAILTNNNIRGFKTRLKNSV